MALVFDVILFSSLMAIEFHEISICFRTIYVVIWLFWIHFFSLSILNVNCSFWKNRKRNQSRDVNAKEWAGTSGGIERGCGAKLLGESGHRNGFHGVNRWWAVFYPSASGFVEKFFCTGWAVPRLHRLRDAILVDMEILLLCFIPHWVVITKSNVSLCYLYV